jgi:hypothetical protein
VYNTADPSAVVTLSWYVLPEVIVIPLPTLIDTVAPGASEQAIPDAALSVVQAESPATAPVPMNEPPATIDPVLLST